MLTWAYAYMIVKRNVVRKDGFELTVSMILDAAIILIICVTIYNVMVGC